MTKRIVTTTNISFSSGFASEVNVKGNPPTDKLITGRYIELTFEVFLSLI